jgi:hypothetical protein
MPKTVNVMTIQVEDIQRHKHLYAEHIQRHKHLS